MKRQQLFLEVEEKPRPMVERFWDEGLYVDFSPIILSGEEASKIRSLYLDVIEDSIILYDKDRFFTNILDRLRGKLKDLGSKRGWLGKNWYWLLKPDIKFGEVVEIE